ncbi:MAG: glycosyl transferase family 2, partial [Candidatus Marinimicrobia bacterium]|nr:glycosyl transferase family 2 [Candidatus Neomarinimicrobiota bacterium]
MISVENISVEFSGKYIFKDVSIRIKKGDRIGLVGNNGVGKTTFLRLISNNQTPSNGRILITKDIEIGYLPQEIYFYKNIELKKIVIGNNKNLKLIESQINDINQTLENNNIEVKQQIFLINKLDDLHEKLNIIQLQNKEVLAEKVMKGLGFKRSDFNRKISEFSGGWRMRAELSRLLVSEPNILLLDEPTNHLDLSSIIWLEKFLLKSNCVIILVSHDKKFIDKIINRTFEVSNARIKEFSGNYTKYINHREKEVLTQIKEKKKQDSYRKNSIKLIEKFRYKKNKAVFAQTLIQRLEKLEKIEIDDFDISKISFDFPQPTHCGQLVYKCSQLSKYFDKKMVFENVELDIYKGDKVAFVGKNGFGKTTLTKIINKEESYDGKSKIGENVEVNYFAQNQNELLDKESTIIGYLENSSPDKKKSELRGLLGAFLFSGDDILKKIKVLSGGEKARLALCSLLLIPGNLLILDEPTNHLDMFAKDILKLALKKYKGTVIIVSHDRDFLSGLAERVIEFKNGRVREFPGDIDIYLN